MNRRHFLRGAATLGVAGGLGPGVLFRGLPPVTATEAHVEPQAVRFHPDIEPLVRLLEDTARERVLEEVAARIRRGTPYREVLAALFLAGIRNVQPRPIGFKFHAVLVVHASHLASLSSPDGDRWLPLFWAIDQFKASQAADVREGDWTMGPVNESSVPPPHRAARAFTEAMDRWDEAAADAAIVGLVRSAGAHEIFELLLPYGVRDFREIGHKAIYIANSFRALEVIGWHHAEPVLRSVVYAILDRVGDRVNPSTADLPADRPFRRNLELRARIRPAWLEGAEDPGIVPEFLSAVRKGSSQDISQLVVTLLNRGVAPRCLFEGVFQGASELLMRSPGILTLHATTYSNAVHYAYEHARDEGVRRLLVLQAAAFLPLFRGSIPDKGPRLDALDAGSSTAADGEVLEGIFAQIGGGRDRLQAAGQVLGFLGRGGDPGAFIDRARRLIFLKGRDAHDYKFTSALWEDVRGLTPAARNRVLAASVFNLRGSGEPDNELVARTRAAFSG